MDTLIKVIVEVPYPKEFEFRQHGTVSSAIGKSIRAIRKQLKGKRLRHYRITCTVL